jgi:urease accessory protein
MRSQLKIEVAKQQGRTVLQNSFVMPPFKVANITENRHSNELHLVLMSSSPGILDKDVYDVNIHVHENASLRLDTQSYQRLFPMSEGATQLMEVVVEAGASLIYIPHPTVPHKDAIFKASNQIFLAKNATLIWGEIITCGRIREGEVFQFTRFHSITSIYMDGKLLVKENLYLEPGVTDLRALGQLEGYTHQAGLIIIKPGNIIAELKETLYTMLEEQAGICFGISSTLQQGLLIRILGYKAEQLFDCLRQLAAIASSKHEKELQLS